ncbi:MAG TPA: carboxypeptidase regulatory-like domain-containing protein [Terracidiphilus sp.]
MRFSVKHILAVSIFLLLGSASQISWAQFNSSVEGTVTDQTGAVVPNAQVVLHSRQTGIDLTATTESTGLYRFNAVGPGDYQVIVTATGFEKKTTDAHVVQDEVAAVNVSLGVSGTTAVVNVTTQNGQLNPDETRLQTTLEAQQIENLPLQNGSILETVRTAPGVTGIDEDRSLSPVSINGNSMNAQANGRPNAGNTYELDGVNIQDNTGYAGGANRNLTFSPAEDMVDEVALEVNSYAVDYGSASSMRVNITTKGGTNKFHGTLGDRYSGRGLNATPDFASPAAPNSRRWYSASLGGPIWKDKTFFFFSYLHQTQSTSSNSLIQYATNDFTGTWAPANYPNGVNVQNLLVPFQIGSGANGQVAATTKTGVVDYASDLFPTNTPGTCAVPVKNLPFYLGQQIGSKPIPCGMEVVDEGLFNQAPRVDGFQVDGRVDQYFRGGLDRVYADYVLEPQISDFIWWRPGFNSTTPGGSRYGNFSYTHIFTANLLNQFKASYVRFYNSFTPNTANVIPFLSLMIGGGDGSTDYFGTPADPAWQKAHNLIFHDDVTWTHGRHNVKAGLSVSRLGQYQQNAGADSKAQTPLYFGWSDLLDDQPWSYSLDTLSGTTGKFLANIQGATVTQIGLYAQDDWKVKPNLLVTLGLRWDDYGNPSPWGANVLPYYNMISPSDSTLQQNIINDKISSAKVSSAFAGNQDLNFLPRVGFAWTPFPSRKLTVHGGAGFYEDATNVYGVVNGLEINSPSYLNLAFGYSNPSPLNDVDPRNFYGTNWQSPAPFGNTYSFPSIVPTGVDSHGEVILNEGGTPSILPSALSGVDPHLKPQKTSLYSLQVEQQLAHNLIVGAGYSGSFSWGQYANGDYNTFPGDMIANGGVEKRLSPEWGSISRNENLLSTNYNAIILTAHQDVHRLSWHASFTFAKTLGYGGQMLTGASSNGVTTASSIADIYDPQHYYGPAQGSVPVSFNGSASYELPGAGLHNILEKAVLGGWTFSAVTTAQSGSPFSLITTAAFVPLSSAMPSQGGPACTPPATTCGTDISNPSAAGGYLANGYTDNLVNVPAGLKRKGFSRAQWKYGVFSSLGYTSNSIPTYSVASSGPGFTNPVGYGVNPVYSNQGFNSFVGPGYLGFDGALHKKVLLPWFGKEGGSTLTLGIEGSNIINRVNLENPASTDLNTVSAFGLGVSQSANQGRIFQVVGKFQF